MRMRAECAEEEEVRSHKKNKIQGSFQTFRYNLLFLYSNFIKIAIHKIQILNYI